MTDSLGLFVSVFIALVFASTFAIFWSADNNATTKMDADRQNWTSIQVLDLPVTVTRTIMPDGTTFVLTPAGDERWVFFTFGNQVSQSFSTTVQPYEWSGSAYGLLPPDIWPAVDLKIVRVNGTEEHYSLPTRGGAVR